MSKRVRTLLRVSSRQQLHDDDIPVQRAEAEQYIAKQPDWIFDREYMEKAVSAYKNSVEDREVLQQILADAREKQFDVLLTYMSDRIGRQEEYSFYVATLNRLGIEVWTIRDGQLKTEEHVDRLLNYIRFWQNEGESKKTGMRVGDTQREMVKEGRFVGGKAPFGYRLVPSGIISNHGRLLKKLEIVEEEAEIVRKIYRLAICQGLGYEKIANTLNAEGIRTITSDTWKPGTVGGILKNPIYMGYYAIHRRAGNGSGARLDRRDWIYSENQISELVIIPQPMWEKAQQIRETRKNKISAAKEQSAKQYEEQYRVPLCTGGKLALTGLAYCGYCGKRLKNGSYCNHWTVKATGERKVSFAGRYVCPGKCRERSCYSQDYLESIVFRAVKEFLKQLHTMDLSLEIRKIRQLVKAGFEKELEQIAKQQQILQLDIETLEEKIPEAIRGNYCFSAGKLSELIREKADRKRELEIKKEKMKVRRNQADCREEETKQLMNETLNWTKLFEDTDPATRKMLLAALIDKIIVKDRDIVVKFRFHPDALADNEQTE